MMTNVVGSIDRIGSRSFKPYPFWSRKMASCMSAWRMQSTAPNKFHSTRQAQVQASFWRHFCCPHGLAMENEPWLPHDIQIGSGREKCHE